MTGFYNERCSLELDCVRRWIGIDGDFGGVMSKQETKLDIAAKKLEQMLAKQRDDWCKWRQSGSKYKSVINGVRR